MKSLGSRDKLQAAAAASGHRRVLLLVFASCFAFATFLTFLYSSSSFASPAASSRYGSSAASTSSSSLSGSGPGGALPLPVFDALVHYASFSNATHRMTDTDIWAISAILRARGPCNLLVFGLGAESPLWLALNHGGRTVYLDENEFYVKYLEPRHPGLEAYDVSYTTKVRDFKDLLEAARASRAAECRPVQNLLFSECRLAINDLPNELYDVPWDVVLIDGPSVGIRIRRADAVHLHHGGPRAVLSKEFLCDENRVAGSGTPSLAHFVIRPGGAGAGFCSAGQENSGQTAGEKARK
ncbi:hypothetical protein ACQ4PT_017418 [Festuca glaucescens]